MGKTYESLIDDDFGVDLYEDDMNIEMDVNEDMEQFLDNQNSPDRLEGSLAIQRSKSGSGHDDNYNQHRLPDDWQDFDYAPDSSLDDDWS